MRSLLAALGMLLLAGTSVESASYSTAELCKVLQPCVAPAKYAAGPYLAKPIIRVVSLREVQSACGGPFALNRKGAATIHAVMSGDGTLGCASIANNNCVVHVPGDLKSVLPDLYRLVLAHELAHCRGWVHERY
jgi:hypothetical protein